MNFEALDMVKTLYQVSQGGAYCINPQARLSSSDAILVLIRLVRRKFLGATPSIICFKSRSVSGLQASMIITSPKSCA